MDKLPFKIGDVPIQRNFDRLVKDRDALAARVAVLEGNVQNVIVRGPFTRSVASLAAAAGSGALAATVALPTGATDANTVVAGLPNANDRIFCAGYVVVSLTQINLSFFNPTGVASAAQTFRFYTLTTL